jgi:hypothetical protein
LQKSPQQNRLGRKRGAVLPFKHKFQTLTYDNGKEFAMHLLIDKILLTQGYFAHPYSSWEQDLMRTPTDLSANTSRRKQTSKI